MDLVAKGFIIGIGKILPGISGAVLAMSLGEYDKIISNIATLKSNTYEKLKYLSKIGFGIIIAIIIASKIIVKCLNKYYSATILLFIGIIIGKMHKTKNEKKHKKEDIIITILITTIIIIFKKIKFIATNYKLEYNLINFIKTILIGIIDSISSIIPGISGTVILMTTGYYHTIMKSFSTITNITKIKENSFILIPFIFGFTIGTFLVAKIINIIIQKYPNKMNTITTSFMLITTFILMKDIIANISSINEYTISIVSFVLGIILAKQKVIKTNKLNIFK